MIAMFRQSCAAAASPSIHPLHIGVSRLRAHSQPYSSPWAKLQGHTNYLPPQAAADDGTKPVSRRTRFTQAASIKPENRDAELEFIRAELEAVLGMDSKDAAKVVKRAGADSGRRYVLSLDNCRGWILTLQQLGLDKDGIAYGIKLCPSLLSFSAAGREERTTAVLDVLRQAGLSDKQVLVVLRGYPTVLVYEAATIAEKLDRLAELGFPPTDAEGLLMKKPMIIVSSLQWDTIEWLSKEGFSPEDARRMVIGFPELITCSPESNLRPTLDYFIWVLGSRDMACEVLTKNYKLLGSCPAGIHAKLQHIVDALGCSPSRMMFENYGFVTYGMQTRIGPVCLLLKALGATSDAIVYSSCWFKYSEDKVVTWGPLLNAWHATGHSTFPGSANLGDALDLCKRRWDEAENGHFEERLAAMKMALKQSGLQGLSDMSAESGSPTPR